MNTELIYSTILPWIISGCLCVIIGIGSVNLVTFSLHASKKFWHIAPILFAIIAIGAFIRFSWVPDGHRILFDEDRYLSYAVSFARFNKAVSLELATPKQSIIGTPDQAIRITVPVMHGWVLKLFGYSEEHLFVFARITSILQILLIFIAGYLLFQSYPMALWGALGIALLPTPVFWSVSLNLDNYFILFSLLGIISSIMVAKKLSSVNAVFFLTSLLVLLCVRFEGVLFVLILFGIIGYVRYTNHQFTIHKKDIFFALCTMGVIAFRTFLSLSVLTKRWCCAESLPLEAFTTQSVTRNILPNLLSFFGKIEFPFIITLLSLYAIFAIRDFRVKIMTFWVALYFTLYCFYYAGLFFTYEFSGSYGRYFLIFIIPLLFLSGMTIQFLITVWKKQSSSHIYFFIGIGLCCLSLIPTIRSYKKLVSVSPYDRIVDLGPRTMHIFFTDHILPAIPPNSILIFPLTANTLMAGHTALYNDTFNKSLLAQDVVTQAINDGQHAYMLQTHYCDLYPDKCDWFNARFTSKQVLVTTLNQTIFQLDELIRKE